MAFRGTSTGSVLVNVWKHGSYGLQIEEESAQGAGRSSAAGVQAKLAAYQNKVAIEGDLGEADVAELESMAPVQDREEKQWLVRLHVCHPESRSCGVLECAR